MSINHLMDADDLAVLYTSFELDSPVDLQNKVFNEFMIYFSNLAGADKSRF